MSAPPQRVDSLRAEARAVEHGHHAWRQDDGSFLVQSATRDRIKWRVTYHGRPWGGRLLLVLRCDCESGSARTDSVPCWHAALVARRLEREGFATWDSGLWWATSKTIDAVKQHARPAVRRRLEAVTDLWERPTRESVPDGIRCPCCDDLVAPTRDGRCPVDYTILRRDR